MYVVGVKDDFRRFTMYVVGVRDDIGLLVCLIYVQFILKFIQKFMFISSVHVQFHFMFISDDTFNVIFYYFMSSLYFSNLQLIVSYLARTYQYTEWNVERPSSLKNCKFARKKKIKKQKKRREKE